MTNPRNTIPDSPRSRSEARRVAAQTCTPLSRSDSELESIRHELTEFAGDMAAALGSDEPSAELIEVRRLIQRLDEILEEA